MSSTNKKIAIIGAGVAGLLAAVTAADRGAKVMLFEKMPKVGLKMGITDVNKVLTLDDLVKGDDCMFTATAITNCNMLHGLNYFNEGVRTHTISARYKTGTVRFVDAIHSLDKKVLAVKL